MSSLTHLEKQKLERALGMASGYVLAFSNRTFDDFFREVVGVDICESRFDQGSGSKANRMRAFWQLASDDQVVSLLVGLRDGWELYANGPIAPSADQLLVQITARLGGGPVAHEEAPHPSAMDSEKLDKLAAQLLAVSRLDPQTRGYEFERFLKAMFDAHGLSGRASFRIVGEQIDGSFVLQNETYLLEAKWDGQKTGAAALHTFQGKLREKAAWSRGLFVSYSGFSEDGLEAFGRGKSVICMDGLDLCEMLGRGLSFAEVVETKARRAAETGSPFIPVRDLFL